MGIKQKLQHPFALIAQGFVVGAVLFWATAPREADARPLTPTIETVAPIVSG